MVKRTEPEAGEISDDLSARFAAMRRRFAEVVTSVSPAPHHELERWLRAQIEVEEALRRETLGVLQREVDRKSIELQKADATLQEVTSKKSRLEVRISDLETLLAESQTAISQLRVDLEKSREFASLLQDVQADKKRLEADKKRLEVDNSIYLGKIESLNRDLLRKHIECLDKDSANRSVKSEKERLEIANRISLERIDGLEKELDRLRLRPSNADFVKNLTVIEGLKSVRIQSALSGHFLDASKFSDSLYVPILVPLESYGVGRFWKLICKAPDICCGNVHGYFSIVLHESSGDGRYFLTMVSGSGILAISCHPKNYSGNQLWSFESTGDGSGCFFIKSMSNNHVLTLQGGQIVPKQNRMTPAQKWYLKADLHGER